MSARARTLLSRSLVPEVVQGKADVQPGIDKVLEGPTGTSNDCELMPKANRDIEGNDSVSQKIGIVAAPARTAAQLSAGRPAGPGNILGGASLSRSREQKVPKQHCDSSLRDPLSSSRRKNSASSTTRPDCTAKVVPGDAGGKGARAGLGSGGMVPAAKGVGVARDSVKRHRPNTAEHATAFEDSQQGGDTVKRHCSNTAEQRHRSNTTESLVREDVQGAADGQPGIDEVSEGDLTGRDEGNRVGGATLSRSREPGFNEVLACDVQPGIDEVSEGDPTQAGGDEGPTGNDYQLMLSEGHPTGGDEGNRVGGATLSRSCEPGIHEVLEGDVQPGIDQVSVGPTGNDEGPTGNDYELLREGNIARNGALMEKLGFDQHELPAGRPAVVGCASLSRSQKVPKDGCHRRNPPRTTTRADHSQQGGDATSGNLVNLNAATTQAGTARKAKLGATVTMSRPEVWVWPGTP